MNALDIKKLAFSYGSKDILSNINLSIKNGEVVCLLGHSGCGKTTLLKAISGLLRPTKGTIYFQGQKISSQSQIVPPEKRGIGMIFQDYALFPHLTVVQNIAFGLTKLTSKEKKQRVEEMLELIKLQGLHKRYPHELSGGQQQRVAIARALANKPGLLLLDEPFSNIDNQVRQRLVLEIRDILKQQNVAALFVTHSRDEGFSFADRLAVMNKGKIIQAGSVYNLYHKPIDRFIADFMGVGNYISAEIIDNDYIKTDLGIIKSTTKINQYKSQKTFIFIRPHVLKFKYVSSNSNNTVGIVRQHFMGKAIQSEVIHKNQTLIIEHSTAIPDNQSVELTIRPHPVILFNEEGKALS